MFPNYSENNYKLSHPINSNLRRSGPAAINEAKHNLNNSKNFS